MCNQSILSSCRGVDNTRDMLMAILGEYARDIERECAISQVINIPTNIDIYIYMPINISMRVVYKNRMYSSIKTNQPNYKMI